jgi:hypothetical protein
MDQASPESKPSVSRPPGAPRWVKVLGLIGIALVVLVVLLHLTGNSPGGPGSHMLPGQPSLQQP